MRPLEEYIEHADELAQNVVTAWDNNVEAGNAANFSPAFKRLMERAWIYREAKKRADNHREFDCFTKEDATWVAQTREAFTREYRSFELKVIQ